MSRLITLTNNQFQAIGNTTLPSEYPADPPVVFWKGKVYVTTGGGGWTMSPGNYEAYSENATITLKDDAFVPPDVVPPESR